MESDTGTTSMGAAARSTAAVRAHLDHCRLRNLRPATIYQRRRVLVRLRQAVECELLDATHDVLSAWYGGRHLAAESRAVELSHVRQFYRWALLEGLIASDPTLRLVRPRLGRRLPRPIPEEDLARALASAGERVRPWLYLAAFAGLRVGEIAGLRRQDLLLDATPPILIVNDGKGGKQRIVPLARVVIDALREAELPARGWVFPRRDGRAGPMPAYLVSHYGNDHLHSIGIAMTMHTLRHRFATALYAQTHDLRLTQETLGHASPTTTAGYAAWSPAEAAAAVEALTR